MKTLRLAQIGLCIVSLLGSATIARADSTNFNGTWVMLNADGSPKTISLIITPDGDQFTVLHKLGGGQSAFQADGTASGDVIAWTEQEEMGHGKVANFVYHAKVMGNRMHGVVSISGMDFGGSFDARREN